MAIQFRSLFPLALPGMLALLGWWWFFSRKKEPISKQDKQVEAIAVELRRDPATEEPPVLEDTCPRVVSTPLSVTQLPEKELSATSKPSVEPPALLRAHPTLRKSESSGSLNTTDTRFRPGTRKDDSAKLELPLTCDEAKSIPLEHPLLSPKGEPFPHDAIEGCKQEPMFSRTPGKAWPGQPAALAEKWGPGEKAKELGHTEGTGDAVLGESVLEEAVLSQEHGSELENGKAASLAPRQLGEEKGKPSPPQGPGLVQEEDSVVEELVHTELVKDEEVPVPGVRDDQPRDEDQAGEAIKEEMADTNEKLEQAAFQIISKVILEAAEAMQATRGGEITGGVHPASDNELQGPEEERGAPVSQEAVLEQGAAAPTLAIAEVPAAMLPTALSLSDPLAEDPCRPKTYVSCLNRSLSSPTKDSKPPRNSAYHISMTSCPSQAAPPGEPPDNTNVLVEDAGCVTCTSGGNQDAPSVGSSGRCSDSTSTSGIEDCCTDTNSSPRDKSITPPLPESTVPFSNGVLKEELSDLGAEDGWSVDAETDHSGGSDGNSMDSVDSGCNLSKTEGFQSAQAGSDPKKVDLIIWEIEVPKHLVGRLIGKQGRYVSFLKQTSGAKIYISTLPYTQNIQICHIEGSQHHVDKALNLIGKKFKELNLTNIYAPPLPSLALPSLPMTSWLMLPNGITVEVIVVNQVNAGHLFVQQHTHPTFHALRSLDQQMYLCYSQPGIPTLPTPVEIAVICAAPGADGAWWRAQVVASYEETNEVEIRYVDYGGYKRVKVDVLRQIRSDFVTLPFQGAEVLLDNVMPLSDEEHFSPEADAAMSEMTGNTALLAQVTSYSQSGLPLIQLWSVVGEEMVLINQWLVERGLAQWVDSCYTSL
ncbi:PREDICTED: A-kinase anchor protein 1, mitochondrial [Elephantulus edwardii]|uniref:A-kinase anchor protein 1, mitochondrial n=1 Tax=Elephantulus edwardii TaxID=28737 RepID=UPI0003F0D487|nr:PREDICTED: A-kinase anchor protein 1, mitochondrial [Elephantulus edwardii]